MSLFYTDAHHKCGNHDGWHVGGITGTAPLWVIDSMNAIESYDVSAITYSLL